MFQIMQHALPASIVGALEGSGVAYWVGAATDCSKGHAKAGTQQRLRYQCMYQYSAHAVTIQGSCVYIPVPFKAATQF